MSEDQNIPEKNSEEEILNPKLEEVNATILPIARAGSQEENIEQPETEIITSETENMEAHHHPHVHHSKKWKDYLFEFLMLFLAVSAGFFVDNIREHYIEQERAEEYAHTLLKDVIKDTIELHKTITRYQRSINSIDTLQQLRKSYKNSMPDILFLLYGRPALGVYRMSFNDATLQQLKNSGNLRYFRSLKLKEKISEYDNTIRTFMLRQDLELTLTPSVTEFGFKLFDYDAVHLYLYRPRNEIPVDSLIKEKLHFLTKDRALINQFFNYCDSRKVNWELRIEVNINPTLSIARDLITMLKQEYNFNEEK